MVGKTLGHYEILEPLGKGGMGEVYRARDTKLDRDVAIKVLPEDFASDPDRLARFEREAKLLASLNHANIAAIYGLEDEGDQRFIVMEVVEGETLAERISRSGRIDVDEVLDIARQITEALEAAHENGVIHRDLKPANVIVTPDGKVKVLDFGLAKAYEADGSPSGISPDLSHSPTMVAVTQTGVILGTAAYMSPEQARGLPVDRRSDLWSFGVLLWELLAGKSPFQGETVSDTLAAVLRADLDWGELPTAMPRPLRRLLRRCLVRTPADRLHHAADARIEIEDALTVGHDEPVAEARGRHQMVPWGLAAGFLVIALVLAATLVQLKPSPQPLVMLDFAPPEGTSVANADGPATLSPDGTQIVSVVGPFDEEQLTVRRLDSVEYRTLPLDTSMYDPFWSADGRFVGFFAGDGKLKKIDVRAGSAVTVADAGDGRGGTWNAADVIVFAPRANGPLYRVNGSGGDPEPVTTLDTERGETGHWRPRFLPDGRRFLYLAVTGASVTHVQAPRVVTPTGPESDLSLWVGSLDGDPPVAIPGSFNSTVTYAAPGHLLFLRDRTLMARPFDLARLAWRGEPVILADGVDLTSEFGTPSFSVSTNGVLTYHRQSPPPNRRLVWRDRAGVRISELIAPGDPVNIDLAPGGRRLAVQRKGMLGGWDVWIVDLERGTHMRLTFGTTAATGPIWSPDGQRVGYVRRDPGRYRLLTKAATGTGSETTVFESAEALEAVDWSPDGKSILIEGIGTFGDLWVLPVDGQEEPAPFVTTPSGEHSGRFSPDGRWIAYVSSESGRSEIYIQPWPQRGDRWQISTEGGEAPRWGSEGEEIFYQDPARRLMAVPLDLSPDGTLDPGLPGLLFETRSTQYEPSPDGRQFLFVEPAENTRPLPATVVLNWSRLLERGSQ